MESITITPRNKRQSDVIKSLFKEMDVPFIEKEKESLDAKIFRLYEEKHYNSEELEWFFSIPEEYRIDPFEMVDSGDIFWADQRNIDQLETNIEYNKKEKEKGNYTIIKTQDELNAFFDGL